jgi:DNA-binding NtrC family response regulator
VKGVSAAAMRQLEHYDWPGNVRELRNVIERATILARGGLDRARAPAGCRPGAVRRRPARPAAPSNGVTIVPGK